MSVLKKIKDFFGVTEDVYAAKIDELLAPGKKVAKAPAKKVAKKAPAKKTAKKAPTKKVVKKTAKKVAKKAPAKKTK
jgi:hypothetical protein